MSKQYPGGVISKTPPVPSGPYADSTAPGVWTLDQQAAYAKQGNWPTAGNVNPDAFIENLFQTWLYTGNGTTQTITNGIDLAGKGGLLWLKARSTTGEHALFDTLRGTGTLLNTDSANAARSETGLASFNTDGFSFANAGSTVAINFNGRTFASWTFREQPKFFDVVTYTGNGSNNRAISHSLGGTVGCLIVKRTSGIGDWPVWHRSLPAYGGNPQSKSTLYLNATLGGDADVYFGNTAPTSTDFYVDAAANASGSTYVAYLFAHNAGGFGLTGTDNVISCGSYTGTGATLNVSLGYEAQWVLIKPTTVAGNWTMMDNMRGMTQVGVDGTARLRPNTSEAESSLGGSYGAFPNATGFTVKSNPGVDDYNASGQTYIYIAIRRGPMKVPTTGTSVFTPVARTGTNAAATVTGVGFPVDFGIFNIRSNAGYFNGVLDRLRGVTQQLVSSQTNAEVTRTGNIGVSSFASNTGLSLIADDYGFSNENGPTYIQWLFGRAPGFFDEVCYTGAGNGTVISHNLGVEPELAIFKGRSSGADWVVRAPGSGSNRYLLLNTTNAQADASGWYSATSSQITFPTSYAGTATSGQTFVAYLFATCPGVSKVGTYTGTGTTQTINCGFTGGSRFVLIKRTDSTGDWYVWDSARGIIAGNDPYLLLNSTAAEVTNTDFVDTAATGFEISSTAPAAINASGGTFIFLAIS